MKSSQDPFAILNDSVDVVAQRLLGCELVREIDGQTVRVRIVETEAYDQTDAASHSYKGKTPRTEIMFGPSGHLYVYFTYGMHYCCNIVVGEAGYGAAVLIRAVEPIEGEDAMAAQRPRVNGVGLTNGPSKLCQALGIDRKMNGHDLHQAPFRLVIRPKRPQAEIVVTKRVGISQAKETLWRYYLQGNPYVSGKHRHIDK